MLLLYISLVKSVLFKAWMHGLCEWLPIILLKVRKYAIEEPVFGLAPADRSWLVLTNLSSVPLRLLYCISYFDQLPAVCVPVVCVPSSRLFYCFSQNGIRQCLLVLRWFLKVKYIAHMSTSNFGHTNIAWCSCLVGANCICTYNTFASNQAQKNLKLSCACCITTCLKHNLLETQLAWNKLFETKLSTTAESARRLKF